MTRNPLTTTAASMTIIAIRSMSEMVDPYHVVSASRSWTCSISEMVEPYHFRGRKMALKIRVMISA